MLNPIINYYEGDLPDDLKFYSSIAIDTETTGLDYRNNRLCLVQMCSRDGISYLVKIKKHIIPLNLISILKDNSVKKIFHFARFDLAVLFKSFNIRICNI